MTTLELNPLEEKLKALEEANAQLKRDISLAKTERNKYFEKYMCYSEALGDVLEKICEFKRS